MILPYMIPYSFISYNNIIYVKDPPVIYSIV